MRVQPECPAKGERKFVIRTAARRDRWPGNPGNAILLPRRRETVPVNEARLTDLIFDPNPKPGSDMGGKTFGSVGMADAKDRGRLAVDLDRALYQPQHGRRRLRLGRCQRGSRA